MKKLSIQITWFLLFTSLTFESMAREDRFKDFEYKIDSKSCKVEDYKKRGFDFFSLRDGIVDVFKRDENIHDFMRPIRNVAVPAVSYHTPPGEKKRAIDFEYYDDDNPFEVPIYRIVYYEKYDENNNVIESWSRSSCKIKHVTLPDALHGRWFTFSEDTPYRMGNMKGIQSMELIQDDLSWQYESNYLFSWPKEKQEETGDYSSVYCQCQFTGVITSVRGRSDFDDVDLRWFRLKYGSDTIPDYSVSYRLTKIELLGSSENSEKCPELVTEANKYLHNFASRANAYPHFKDYMIFGEVFLLGKGDRRFIDFEGISFRKDGLSAPAGGLSTPATGGS